MNLYEIKTYLDELLQIEKFDDYCINGLQVENNGEIDILYGGVDISSEIADKCRRNTLILVHHGIFWSKPVAITKNVYKIVKSLINKNCALYACHLPLDGHEEFGNNHGFYKLLGWENYKTEPFGEAKGKFLSSIVEFPQKRSMKKVLQDIQKILGKDVLFWNFGKDKVKRLAFLSGGGADLLDKAVHKQLDLYITGETNHNVYWYAKDNNINVIFGGHYKTEDTGVKLLLEHMAEKFGLKGKFIDLPTGL